MLTTFQRLVSRQRLE